MSIAGVVYESDKLATSQERAAQRAACAACTALESHADDVQTPFDCTKEASGYLDVNAKQLAAAAEESSL